MRRAVVTALSAVAVVAFVPVAAGYPDVSAGVAKAKPQKCPKGKEAARVYQGNVVIGGSKGRAICVKRVSLPKMSSPASQVQALGALTAADLPKPPKGPTAAQVPVVLAMAKQALARLAALVSSGTRMATRAAGPVARAAGLGSWTPDWQQQTDPGSGHVSGTAHQTDPPPDGKVGSTHRNGSQEIWPEENGSATFTDEVQTLVNKCPGPDGVLRGTVDVRFTRTLVVFLRNARTGRNEDHGFTDTLSASVNLAANVLPSGRLGSTFGFKGTGRWKIVDRLDGSTISSEPIRFGVFNLPFSGTPFVTLDTGTFVRFTPVPGVEEGVRLQALELGYRIDAEAKRELKASEKAWLANWNCTPIDAPASLTAKKGQRVSLTATVRDSKGHPITGALLKAQASGGKITPAQTKSTGGGKARFTYTSSKGDAGAINLTTTSTRGTGRRTIDVNRSWPKEYKGTFNATEKPALTGGWSGTITLTGGETTRGSARYVATSGSGSGSIHGTSPCGSACVPQPGYDYPCRIDETFTFGVRSGLGGLELTADPRSNSVLANSSNYVMAQAVGTGFNSCWESQPHQENYLRQVLSFAPFPARLGGKPGIVVAHGSTPPRTLSGTYDAGGGEVYHWSLTASK